MNINKRKIIQIIIVLLLMISVVGNMILGTYIINKEVLFGKKNDTITNSNYPLLAKRIFLEDANDIIINLTPLRTDLNEYINDVNTNEDTEVSVYFEYLPSGGTIGIESNINFNIASLLKLPVAMGLLNNISDSLTLQTPVTIKQEHLDSGYGNLWKNGAGQTLSVENLLYEALVHSDNTAFQAIKSLTPENKVTEIFSELDIPDVPQRDQLGISVRSYTSILRSLYFSSLLSRDNSQYLLDMLTKEPKRSYIPLGIPDNIPIAHKNGEYASEKIISDCGIVYVPKRPYMLCIMNKGYEKEQAGQIIQNISSMIYSYIKNVE